MGAGMNEVRLDQDIEILRLEKWLDYASGIDESVYVALPVIQRGSVWKPKQIIDLWDSLLRGMPMGSLMYSPMPANILVRKVGGQVLEKAKAGTIGLIDGQQRTLAMLIAWNHAGERMDRRIWVDFSDKPGDENLFRFHVTTKNQPFGFQKASPSTKLPLGERRDARLKFEATHGRTDLSQQFIFENATPHHSKCPLDVRELIELWRVGKGNPALWIQNVQQMVKRFYNGQFSTTELSQIESTVSKFAAALDRLFQLNVPLIKVDLDFFSGDEAAALTEESNDPPLAILFKRIGTGGTPLSDADYVYSVIKHRIPEAYTLVEELHRPGNIARLLSATDLVMTAVRLGAAEFSGAVSKLLTDWESPNKQDFHRLIKQPGFLVNGFLPLIKTDALAQAFAALGVLLEYQKDTNPIGIPSHAFPLLSRPLVQVLLRWVRIVQRSHPVDLGAVLFESRAEVLRFVMYWQLCVIDPRKASLLAFEVLASTKPEAGFPGSEIYRVFLNKEVAVPVLSPAWIEETKRDVAFSPADLTRLRGGTRFDARQATKEEKTVIDLYQRWWGNGRTYVHPLLLWLQRETVAGFDGSPVAGRDEDTPYDYDHICPANHWSNWTGEKRTDTLLSFLAEGDKEGHWRVGNSIGNIRVWQSEKNRSDGAAAPSKKLELDNPETRSALLAQSSIDAAQIAGWTDCSGERSWNETRVQAFQKVVEQRAFALYERFYTELGFLEWSATSA
ncbi:MAG: hypothetical protein A3J24_08780 [Deltaproteobacteria bacterium RIFCSPLOWO2_02_FULL_53_8]|nr:MAG: hypothetical protein A3J24_08780 [Deltaproteobacteria bacterium RIFCSPLOWO2_02_FULL_53_8]